MLACSGAAPSAGPVRRCTEQLRYAPDISGAVQIRGEWSNFAAEPMTEKNGVWSWEGTLPQRQQGYAYRYEVNGEQLNDPLNGFTRWVGQTEYSRVFTPDCSKPLVEVTQFEVTASGELTVALLASLGSANRTLSPPVIALDDATLTEPLNAATGVFTVHQTGLSAGKHRLSIELSDVSGAKAEPLILPFWVEAKPFQWRDALLYFAFTDRFRDGDPANSTPTPKVDPQANYQGGDFAGLTAVIDEGYFDKLGVTAIWLSPVDQNPDGAFMGTGGHLYTGYHGYWPSAPRAVQTRFGDLAALKKLTHTAHAHGIRVVGDLVLNHVHESHPYFTAHQDDGWFNTGNSCVCGTSGCSYDDKPLVCWFTAYLPDVNWRNTAVADQVTSDVLWWVENADFDGFRLDAVKHFDQTAVRSVRASLAKITAVTGVPFYLVGETFTGSDGRAQIKSVIGPQLLDGQFDFPLYWPVIDAFAKGQSLRGVEAAMRQNELTYSAETVNSPFLGNHDVARFISTAAGQITDDPGGQAWASTKPPSTVESDEAFRKAKWAFTFVLTQPGMPLIYYGDEIGLPGAGDPDNRRLMKWGALLPREADLLAFMQKLGTTRQAHAALRTGARDTLFVDDEALVLQKSSADEAVLVVINRSASARTVAVSLTRQLAGASHAFVDALSGATLEVSTELTMPANASMLLIEKR